MISLPTETTLGWVTIRGEERMLGEWKFGGTWLRKDGATQCGWSDEDVTKFEPAVAIPVADVFPMPTSKPLESDPLAVERSLLARAWAAGYLAALNDTDSGFPSANGSTPNPYMREGS